MPSPSDKTAAAGAKTATVLVVDDEPTIVEIVGRYMERAGFETYTAPTATGRSTPPPSTGPTSSCST